MAELESGGVGGGGGGGGGRGRVVGINIDGKYNCS